jgi:membrane-bound serine protease (ClpP class)
VKRPILRAFLASLAAAVGFLVAPAAHAADRPRVLAVHFQGLDINPITQSYVNHQIDRANKQHFDAVAILLDTPGGLSSSMEKIYQKELASKIPVIVYVSPSGAGAASAGVFVAEAADLLAMAPETNIGSSTPIGSNGGNLGSDERRKTINHFAAKLRGFAQSHGRNVQWADAAVRKASNLSAAEALRMHVIDMVAPSLPALLRQADGFVTKPHHYRLHLANAEIVNVHPGFFTRLLNTLIDPNLIGLLFLAGIAGIAYEVFHPGVVLPGALGAVSLVVSLFGISVLPVSWGAFLLVLLGIFLLLVDAHVTSHGALTVAGLTSLSIGLVALFRNAPSPYHTNIPLVVSIAVALGLFWALGLTKAVEARRRPVSVGPQTIIGEIGEARGDRLVFVHGELWQARTANDDEPLRPGDRVRVEAVEPDLVLDVKRVDSPAEMAS